MSLDATASTPEPNPWSETPKQEEKATPAEPRPVELSDSSLLDDSFAQGFKNEPSTSLDLQPSNVEQVISEFDPLANKEEAAAKEAWENTEPHPPPPPPRTPSPPPTPPSKDIETPGPTTPSASVFPSFSSLAKTFSLPLKPKSRPGSIDNARPVPSPSKLSNFVEQQTRQQSESTGAPEMSGRTPEPPPTTSDDPPPFDFQRFLDQMKSRHAEAVAKYLKSFLSNFSKRTFTVGDQVKIIQDFLNFIARPMRESEIWKNASDAEFDNAMEGMEKLVMNQLYQFTFTPQIAITIPRRQITADDLERDRVLTQRIALFGWIEETHLDIPVGEGSGGFLMFAQQELLKVNHYKAPRDKLICILNCCKVIFGLIRHLKKEEGADSFLPILIFVVLKANPEHLLSNVEFINRFRNPTKLQSEAGYYLSSLMGAVSFIETMDHTSLSNISQEEFEQNVEAAIQSLPADASPTLPHVLPANFLSTPSRGSVSDATSVSSHSTTSSHEGDESAQPLAISTPVQGIQTISEDAKRLLQKTGDTISKPLSALSRILNEALDGVGGPPGESSRAATYLPGPFAPFELGRENRQQQQQVNPPQIPHWSHPDQTRQQQQQQYYYSHHPQTPASSDGFVPPIQTPYKQRVRKVPMGTPPGTPGYGGEDTPSRMAHAGPALVPPRLQSLQIGGYSDDSVSRTPTPNFDLAGMQAQIDSAHEQAAQAARETLLQIFPAMEVEVVQLVLEANDGDLGRSIEALLEMSSGD
ncbi:hypothetical protein MIND_00359000 [Mycena indigotica]|uniref:Vacuolar protein sorting-associated protein 9a n=1 Tax=Mycena indigotica TaxID=2126181 RepID=A0A8H6W8Q6_9AGAR|nr:uncharacterized protein MIND_00359000 [Mycena indigotica]KAF7309869.1 hypothetical protein MIND_00359000 [Mycena indigotica]